MRSYLDLLAKIMDKGTTVQTGATLTKEGRQPTARRLHGEQLVFDLAAGFPAVTTKPLWWRAVVAEWIWFLRGSGDGQYLVDQKVDSIWRSWFKEGTTDLGPVYGRQLRRFQGVKWADRAAAQATLNHRQVRDAGREVYSGDGLEVYSVAGYLYGITPAPSGGRLVSAGGYAVHPMGPHHDVVEVDQIGDARDDIRAVIADPFNRARRRIIVTLWNPAQVPAMALPPCHTFHFYDLVPPGSLDDKPCDTREDFEAWRKDTLDGRWMLNLHLCARSIDAVKGLPFNIASYALMLSVMARITGCKPGTLTITFNDVHIYDNQFADVEEQLQREPYPLPTLELGAVFDAACRDLTIEEAHALTPGMFPLVGYRHHPKLASESEVAV